MKEVKYFKGYSGEMIHIEQYIRGKKYESFNTKK